MRDSKGKIVIVGGGPVGAFTAILMSRRGYQVDVYDARDDIRKDEIECRRSINLSLSHRGITSLKMADFGDEVLSLGTPMHSRCVHVTPTKQVLLPFGKKGEYLLSVSRSELTRQLLSKAEQQENINIHFKHKLVQLDLATPKATFKKATGETLVIDDAKVVFGCDGAYSTVRRNLMKTRMDFKQTYIEHGYKELMVPATKTGDYALNPNYFHIWPRQDILMIAVPNLDKSFTCNLFMPFEKYDEIITGDDVVTFFGKYFSDLLPVVDKEFLKETFFLIPPCPMVTIHCKPHYFGSTCVILGDAAHAMLPFSGQGLNCGLEGALIFDETMEELDCDFKKVLPKFSDLRVNACHVIADYSMQNYIDIRTQITSPWLLFRKKIDGILIRKLPRLFKETHFIVTFSRKPYDKIVTRAAIQRKAVDIGVGTIGVFVDLNKRCSDYKQLTNDVLQEKRERLKQILHERLWVR